MADCQLIGIDTKIARAKQQVCELQAAIRAWVDTTPYEIIEYSEVETKRRVFAIKIRNDLPSGFAGMVGDVLNNLRTSLDYLVWELTDGKGGDRLYFPVAYKAKSVKAMIDGVKHLTLNDAVHLLEATEAYKGGNGHGLWQLHELNRLEKHRPLMPVCAAIGKVAIDIASPMKALWWPGAFVV